MNTNHWRRRYKRLNRAYVRSWLARDMGRLYAVESALHRLEKNPMDAVQTNDRGEFTDAAGKLWHTVSVSEPGDVYTNTQHEGAWLNCDGCNPVVVVRWSMEQNTIMASLRAEYKAAKEQETEVKERVKLATDKLKAALTEASGGALRASLHVPGFKPLNLTYSEPWSVPAADLKAKYPAVYVELAQKGQRWTLAESRGA